MVAVSGPGVGVGATHGDGVSVAPSVAPGVDIIAISVVNGLGLDALSAYMLPGKTIAFLGSSGVGKSSLLNTLAGEEVMDVKAIRDDDSRGRHTTTHRQLILLKSGALAIDTPGMRMLGMWDVGVGLGEAFADIEALMGRCRFADCRHGSEPGCAIKEAIECGAVPEERWESYLKLKREAKYSDNKASFMSERRQFTKDIAKFSKRLKSSSGKRHKT